MITETPITKHYNDVAKCWYETICMIQTDDPIRPRMRDALASLKQSVDQANENEANRTEMAKALKPLTDLSLESLKQPYNNNTYNELTRSGAEVALTEFWQDTLSPIIDKLKPLLAA